MARWVGLVLLMAALRAAAGAEAPGARGRPISNAGATPGLPSRGASKSPEIYYCGYKISKHNITTRDGYKLTAFRLIHNEVGIARRQPVLLQHTLLTNSDCWLMLRGNSLPCVLARTGYDVWLSNARGTKYSWGHENLSPNFYNYWKFSIEEIAVYDLPATIDLILKITGRSNVSYVGHSVGGTMAFIMLSENQDYNQKVNVAVTFSPVCYSNPDLWLRITTGAFYLVRFFLEWYYGAISLLDVLTDLIPVRVTMNDTFTNKDENKKFVLEGLKTLEYATSTRRPQRIDLSENSDFTSIRALLHYSQLVSTGKFRRYMSDSSYGRDLRYIKTPQLIIYSDDDNVVKGKGVRELIRYLDKNVAKSHKVRRNDFGHTDFLYSRHAKLDVYDITVKELNRYLPTPPTPPPPPTTTTPVNPECIV